MFRRPAPSNATAVRTVCLCANTAWYIDNFRSTLIDALRGDGWRTVVYAPVDDRVDALVQRGIEFVPMALNRSGVNPLRELSTLLRFGSDLATIRPDLVLSWTPKVNMYAGLACRRKGVPIIPGISGLGTAFNRGGWMEAVSRRLYRASLREAPVVAFENDDDRRLFIDSNLVDAPRAARVPGAGVDTRRFEPRPRDGPLGRFRFLLVARMLKDKGVLEFVDAAREVRRTHPDAEFACAGFFGTDNPSAISREAFAGWEREGVVRFLGAFEDMRPVYASADCVVLPSYREGLPQTLLEAAAMGLPAITTDVPGCREAVVADETGLLVPARDAPALAKAMRAMLDATPAERASMGARARRRVTERFDQSQVIRFYLRAADAATHMTPCASVATGRTGG